MPKLQKILVIEQRVDLRSVLRDAAKNLGGASTQISGGVLDAWSLLETEDAPDLIITGLELEDPKFNTFHLLALILEHPKFSNTLISICLSENELKYTKALFELGVVSIIQKPLTKAKVCTALDELSKNLSIEGEASRANAAAKFLRERLTEEKDFEALLSLEKSMIAAFPENSELLLNLGEALYFAGQEEEAIQVLRQASIISKDLAFPARQIADLMGAGELLEEKNNSLKDIFGLEHVLIVDTDDQASKIIDDALKMVGVTETTIVENGNKAVSWLEEGNTTGLIIQAWKIPGISGPQLLQRVRQQFHLTTPIIVCSSLLQPEDHILLKEMGASGVLKKPVSLQALLKTVTSVMRQDAFPKGYIAIERKIRSLIEAGDHKGALKIFQGFDAIEEKPPGVAALMTAEIAFLEQDYKKANDYAIKAFKEDGETVEILNIMGKTFLKIGNQDGALKCLNRANTMNAQNLQRLCTLAQVNSEIGNEEGATEALKRADSFDDGATIVKETKAEIAVNSGDTATAKEVMQSLGALDQVVKYMNNRAILLAKEGEIETSLELYKNAVRSLPKGSSKERNIVLYNLGVAFARKGDAKNAVSTLQLIKEFQGPIAAKAKNLLIRAEDSVKSKVPLRLREQSNESMMDVDQSLSKPVAMHARPGQYSLHLIFDVNSFEDMELGKFLQKKPKFSVRIQSLLIKEAPSPSLSTVDIADLLDEPMDDIADSAPSVIEVSSNARVLVVEPDQAAFSNVHLALSELGISKVAHAKSGEDAWNHLLNASFDDEFFELVICSWHLPDVSSLNLLSRIRANDSIDGTKFVVADSSLGDSKMADAEAAGVSGGLKKPYSSEEIRSKFVISPASKIG